MPAKGWPGPSKGQSRPNAWITGPDPLRHKQYRVWLQQRNQAQFRKEEWDLPFEDWLELWGDLWHKRGRHSDQYCMTRADFDLPWDKTNAIIVTRREHCLAHRQRQCELGKLKGYKKRIQV